MWSLVCVFLQSLTTSATATEVENTSTPTNIAMPNVEVNRVPRVRGANGRVGGVEVQVPTTLVEAVAVLRSTKTNCGAQVKRNIEYVMQFVPEDMKESLRVVVDTTPYTAPTRQAL